MPCGMHVTTSLESTPVEVMKRNPSVPFPITSIYSLDTPTAFSPVAFYSHETHYSIMKVMEAMAVHTFYKVGMEKYPQDCPLGTDWPLAVPCEGGGDAGLGTIDINFGRLFSAKGHPIIVIFNYGTTFKGANDDIKTAGEALLPILKKNGMYERKHHLNDLSDPDAFITRKGFWFHVMVYMY